MNANRPLSVVAWLLPLLLSACDGGGEMIFTDVSVDAQPGPVDLTIDLRGGALRVGPGSSVLLEGRCGFNREEMRPEVHEGLSDGRRVVSMDQPAASGVTGRSLNDWEIRLSPEFPIRLKVRNQIAGATELRLAGLNLHRVDVEMGAGNLQIDLANEPLLRSVEGSIHLAHGQMWVRLPRDVGLRVRARDAVGSTEVSGIPETEDGWQNALFGAEGVPFIDLGVGVGSGQIQIEAIDVARDG